MLETLVDASPETIAQIIAEQKIRKTQSLFLLFSLGSQFDHLIKQQLSQLGYFCLVADPAKLNAAAVKRLNPNGIILSGGPASVSVDKIPFDQLIFDLGIPVLGICLGFQLWAQYKGAKVVSAETREFGVHTLKISQPNELFFELPTSMPVLQSHGDKIEPSKTLTSFASTDAAPVSAGNSGHLWGVQFHPEVSDTTYGPQIFTNFCSRICGVTDQFPASLEAQSKVVDLTKQLSGKRVLLALSGGSDSSVVAYLLKAVAKQTKLQIQAVYIKGIDRPDDEAFVQRYFGQQKWLKLKIVDATAAFLQALKGQTTMRDKRIAMRGVYKSVLEHESTIFKADFIAQGTLYTDMSESGGGYQTGAQKAQIKLHHNINLGFNLPELNPLIDCVKDSARNIGESLGVPLELLYRHPFPGPGLVVRVEGEITAAKLSIARRADQIFIEELRKQGLYSSIWQAGAVVTQSEATCTKGDGAESGAVLAIWAVWSVNGFTAQSAELPYPFLRLLSRRLTNEIREIGAVVYRISDKPPTTIEWG